MVLNDATQKVLQQMPKNIVWDEDLLSGSNVCSSLLQKIALGGQYLDSEKAKSIVGLTITEQKFKEILGNVPNAEMCFGGSEEVLSDVNTHERLLQKIAMGAGNLTDEKVKLSVKDDEMTSDLDAQDGLLQLLASSGGYQDDEQNVDCFPGFMELGLVDSDHGFVAELDEDSKQVCEADMDDELTLERNTPFLLGIDTDDVHETPVNINSHDGLSQQLASAREYVYHEKMIPTVQLDFGLSPTISIQDEMGVGSYTRMPKQALILKIGKHHFGYGNGSIIALEKNDSAA